MLEDFDSFVDGHRYLAYLHASLFFYDIAGVSFRVEQGIVELSEGTFSAGNSSIGKFMPHFLHSKACDLAYI